MSKRRRASSGASRGDDSDDAVELNSPGPPPSRKKKKLDPSEICQQLYDTIRSYKKEDGALLCDSFIRAPKRRQEPQYYEVVSNPIDLLRVQQKLKTDSYDDIEELSADMDLLVNNAKAFYNPESVEYKDADQLWKLYEQTRVALENGEEIKTPKLSRTGSSSRRSDVAEDMSETSTNTEEDIYEELFNAVMTANIDGRPLYPAFQFLPSKRRYPEYYNVIEQPIDLKTIAQKIQGGEYTNIGELEKDLLLMARNACHFNEPGSQIYKDAKMLKKVIQIRKQELEQHGRGKTSERIRSKRNSRVGPVPSSRALAIMEPTHDDADHVKHSEDSGDSDEDKNDNEDSPQWKLLESIKNHLGVEGTPMAEPFWKLPSRRAYPDYYKEIKNPMSLNQIKNKIRRGNYGNLSEVAGDMNIMFENAKQYNLPNSKLYKYAVKLQRQMQQRVQELLDIVQSSSSDDESLSSVKNQATPLPRPRGRPPKNSLPSSPSPGTPKTNLPLKKKLHYISKQLVEFTCSDGRQPMLLFMERPSKKLYPEYYSVIDKPIDMIMIENHIKNDRYSSVEEMVADFRLMFSNCRQFNEEGSMIFEDANLLERVMNDKLKEIHNGNHERKSAIKTIKISKPRQLSPFEQKLRTLYDAIRDYRDPKANRQLALIFMKLPSKVEYPDYYELIKNPVDMEKIAQKLKNNYYNAVSELASDFILMFDNACKYNEPDSQIYKDALILHRVCLQTKQMLSREDDDAVPDVPAAVQELLMNLFTTVYNHQDEEGRCYSDSMAELPEHDEATNGEKVRAISLDLVKRRLDKGLYKRLDHFQQDMFSVFERARRLSRTDSQIFEDSVELQTYFISQRDLLCANTLQSTALTFTRDTVATSVELVKQCKLLQENDDEDQETRSSNDDSMIGTPVQQTQYTKGDFVYIHPEKGNKDPSIVHIERVWTNAEGVPMIYANVYYRPQETFHLHTRKFLQQEVFKTDQHRSVPLDQIVGHCYVMNVKEYFKFKPQGFADRDIYVCESRYNTKHRWFKKIKVWESGDKDSLVPRDVPIEPQRNVSVFRERLEKHKDELAELEVLENVQEKDRPDVVMYNPLGTDDENTYYEQYNTVCSGVIKTGDYVYVVTDGGKQMIAQVDTIWETGDNKCYFRGPFLVFPGEVANIINKPFFKQEVLLTTMHDTSPLVGIVGKCAVLDYDDYLKCRLTEIAENDTFVCESLYDESNRVSRKLKAGLRKFEHTKEVTVDEIYFFPKPIGPPALASTTEVQTSSTAAFTQKTYNPHSNVDSMDNKPQFTNLINTTIGSQDVEMILENSMDESSLQSPATPLSIGGNSNPYNPSLAPERSAATPVSSKKKKESKPKVVSGYILYSSEVRKAIIANNPESSFGEISRIVGNEWRNLPASTKQSWEERAARCNEETAARLAEEMRELSAHTQMEMTYECAWDNCDYQFEDLSDCMEHCVGDGTNSYVPPGHVQSHYRGGTTEFACLWRNCARVRKGQAPFPNLPRLTRHVRDLHVNKGNGKMMAVHERSRNFMPSTKKPKVVSIRGGVMSPAASLSAMSPLARNTPSPGAGEGLQTAPAPPSRPTIDPLFVSAPPKPQRVTHSEAYISREDDDAVPDVPAAVQELLMNLFTTVYNHQDEEGRCYSDSMAELPEHDEATNGEKVRAISLDLVKRRLDKGLYKRLDHFQQDMFSVFERARRLSRTDSQIFEDSVELQTYFISQRDLLCANTLQSTALTFTRDTVATSVELVKQCKLLQENDDEDQETRSSNDDSMIGTPVQQTQYTKGDFVYIHPEKGNKDPSIVHIERVWTNAEGVPMIYANVYYRPQETFHLHTRKFLQQEVFKTDQHRSVPLDQVVGHCYVMNVKEYFKFKPQGFADRDIYVCESRYNTKHRWFKKIKVWESGDKDSLVPRDVPIEPQRNVSVFRERLEKHKDELAELEVLENVQEKDRPDVVMYNPLGTDDENTYYEQYNTVCSGVIKTGDYVYVVTDGGKQMIAQVDTIWETGDNKCYFRGPFLVFPGEVANIINKPFFKQEVLLTTMHDTSPLVGIVGKCAVLDYDDYLKCRLTEIAENDTFVCESLYDESNRVSRKLKAGLRKFEHTKEVTVDEIYFFPKPIGPPALASTTEVQTSSTAAFTQKTYNPHSNVDSMDNKPQFTNLINTTIGSQDVEMILENSMDESSLQSPATPLSIGGNSNPYNPSLAPERSAATPVSSKKKKESKPKVVSGYILYSSEVRKAIIANNPESSFGEISRIVGNEWRNLPASTKQSWEERAARCNEETAARLAEEMRELSAHTQMEMTYECAWDNCDYQFEDLSDCMEHCVGDGTNSYVPPGHVQSHYRGGTTEFACLWRNCARVRKGQAPFPNLPRLTRHVRDLHVNKGNGKMMAVHERSRNFMPSTKKPKVVSIRGGVMSPAASLSAMSPLARNTPSPGAGEGLQTAPAPPSRPTIDPLFVSAPPKPQRVTHSEAYIRYIEGLHSEQKYITPWEKSLTPMPINPDPAQFNTHKLPAHWMTEDAINGYLAQDKSLSETDIQKMDQNTKILKGLCSLRDFMMKDALCLYKNY